MVKLTAKTISIIARLGNISIQVGPIDVKANALL
jgi:hypothetical protein